MAGVGFLNGVDGESTNGIDAELIHIWCSHGFSVADKKYPRRNPGVAPRSVGWTKGLYFKSDSPGEVEDSFIDEKLKNDFRLEAGSVLQKFGECTAKEWCGWSDSNRQRGKPQWILSPPRMPISPQPHRTAT